MAYAFVIANSRLHPDANVDELNRYRGSVQATMEPFGGRFLVRAGRYEVLEGDYRPERFTVIQFPDMERSRQWYECAEYREIEPLRTRNADTDLIVIEGV